MKSHLVLLFLLALTAYGCNSNQSGDPSTNNSGSGTGSFEVMVSNNKENKRFTMTATKQTTFSAVAETTIQEMGLAADQFKLMVEGKTPAPTETIGDYLRNDPSPGASPAFMVIVRVKK
ncbi:hypothetical protein OAG56_06365 [Mariniblastus sp.]|nr:hypothetical protein [Mariniblastus sp.]